MRIMYLDSGIGLGGGQWGLIEILKNIDRSKYQPIVVSPDDSGLMHRSKELSVEWYPLPFSSAHHRVATKRFSWLRDVAGSIYAIPYLSFLSRKLNVDILLANTFKTAIVASFVSQLTRKPMIFYDHVFITHRPYDSLIRKTARIILTPSDAVAEKYPPQLKFKVKTVPSGIDCRLLEIGNDPLRTNAVGYLGRISREKGIHLFIQSIPEVLKRSPETRFLICGSAFTSDDKRYLGQLIEKIDALNIRESVNFVGYIDRPENFLSNLRVFVLPSISETLGRVMLEAMAMGIPVVAFNKGGPAEVINDGETGFLVKPFDTDLMAKVIVRLLNDDDLVRKIGSKARMLVKQRYTSEVMVDLLSGVFDEILVNDHR